MRPLLEQYLFTHKRTTVLLATVWTVAILVLCLIPGRELPKVDLWQHTDKLVHFTLFLGLQTLWQGAYPQRRTPILLLLVAYGLLIEVVQHYCVTGRSFDLYDWLADSLGALAAWRWLRAKR
jgi:VanZ family protein